MNSKILIQQDNHESQLCIRNLKSGTTLNIPRTATSGIFCIYLALNSTYFKYDNEGQLQS